MPKFLIPVRFEERRYMTALILRLSSSPGGSCRILAIHRARPRNYPSVNSKPEIRVNFQKQRVTARSSGGAAESILQVITEPTRRTCLRCRLPFISDGLIEAIPGARSSSCSTWCFNKFSRLHHMNNSQYLGIVQTFMPGHPIGYNPFWDWYSCMRPLFPAGHSSRRIQVP